MNELTFVIRTMQLEIAVVDALGDLDCRHKYHDKTGSVEVEVPPEAAHYDVKSGLSWVTLDPKRLPRPYTCQMLLKNGFKEAVADHFGSAVEIIDQGQALAIVSQINVLHEQQRTKTQDLPLAV